MTSLERTLTPEELHHTLDAECKLAEIELYEDLAALHDDESCPLMRRWFADRYRTLIGVNPDQRGQLRQLLDRIRDDGSYSVRAVINQINRPTP